MKDYLNNLNKELKDLINLAKGIAYSHNWPVYLVGGFVRDLILGVKNLDLDIAVEGDGIKFAEDFSAKLKAGFIRHKRFGTATVTMNPVLKVDIATARKEFYPQPASLPVVSSGTLKDDLFRRDFTINAMAISIAKKDFGRLIDFFGGMQDLRQKKIRILHKISFIDDPTRILRAIRFEKRYGFQLEAQTFQALKEAIRARMLERVSAQRIRDEIILILKEEDPLKQIRRIQELTGFGFLSPALSFTPKSFTLLKSVESQIHWFKKECGSRFALQAWIIYFMGLLDPLSIGQVQAICKRFVFRREEEKNIITYKKINKDLIRKLSQPRLKPYTIFGLLENLSYEVIILLKAKHRNRYLSNNVEKFIRFYKGRQLSVRGEDLRKLGIIPGPVYRKILRKVLEEKINGKIITKAQELKLLKKISSLK